MTHTRKQTDAAACAADVVRAEKTYHEATASARNAYDKATASARNAYNESMALALIPFLKTLQRSKPWT